MAANAHLSACQATNRLASQQASQQWRSLGSRTFRPTSKLWLPSLLARLLLVLPLPLPLSYSEMDRHAAILVVASSSLLSLLPLLFFLSHSKPLGYWQVRQPKKLWLNMAPPNVSDGKSVCCWLPRLVVFDANGQAQGDVAAFGCTRWCDGNQKGGRNWRSN